MAFGLWMVLVEWRAAFKAVIPGDVSAAVSLPEIIDSLAKLKGSSLVLIPESCRSSRWAGWWGQLLRPEVMRRRLHRLHQAPARPRPPPRPPPSPPRRLPPSRHGSHVLGRESETSRDEARPCEVRAYVFRSGLSGPKAARLWPACRRRHAGRTTRRSTPSRTVAAAMGGAVAQRPLPPGITTGRFTTRTWRGREGESPRGRRNILCVVGGLGPHQVEPRRRGT